MECVYGQRPNYCACGDKCRYLTRTQLGPNPAPFDVDFGKPIVQATPDSPWSNSAFVERAEKMHGIGMTGVVPEEFKSSPYSYSESPESVAIDEVRAKAIERVRKSGIFLTPEPSPWTPAGVIENLPHDMPTAPQLGTNPKDLLDGRKDDSGKLPWHLLPFDALRAIVTILQFGAVKYAPRNWEKGMDWDRPFAALIRHLTSWWEREPHDHDTGKSHLWHAGCMLIFLIAYEIRGIGKDTRP